MLQEPFENSVIDAMRLLRDLPRERHDLNAAQARVEAFRASHPGTGVQLLVDRPPGSPRLDYDLLIEDGERGTVALSWRADNGVPWSVNYAEHWAANCVATLDHYCLEVQDALLFLSLSTQAAPNLMEELERQLLVGHALQANPIPVDDQEVQGATHRFRVQHKLLTSSQMQQWLQEHGLSLKAFHNLMSAEVQVSKFKRQVTDDRIERYFLDHRDNFDVVQFFRVNALTEAQAFRLAERARLEGLLAAAQGEPLTERIELEGSLVSRYVHDVSEAVARAKVGSVIDPYLCGSHYVVIQVLGRNPAQLDLQTQERVRKSVFEDWISERKKNFSCRWHWM